MHIRSSLILAVSSLLAACGGQSDALPTGVPVFTEFQPDPYPANSEAAGAYTSISSSADHTCGIRTDASLWCWGNNKGGQIGVGQSFEVVEVPTRVPGPSGWERVSTGDGYTCGIRSGSLFCWGSNSFGQLGDGTTKSQATPRLISNAGWIDVSTANNLTCAVNRGGRVYCWGYDYKGQITGHADEADSWAVKTPALLDVTGGFRQVVTGSGIACALDNDGSFWCWGIPTVREGEPPNPILRLGKDADWVSLSMHGGQPCGSKADHSLWCWDDFKNKFVRDALDWQAVPLSAKSHFCGVAVDGTLRCSGSDSFGQLGNGEPRLENAAPVQVGARSDWKSVVVGAKHSCALNQSGEVWCWGADDSDQLGIGRKRTTDAPVLVGEEWDSVSPGTRGTCGIKAGHIWCWGEVGPVERQMPLDMPLPNAAPVATAPPKLINGLPRDTQVIAEQVSVQGGETCALTLGQVSCFGGFLNPTYDSLPLRQLVVNYNHACGIGVDGALFCWGGNSSGELGNGTNTDIEMPERIGLDVWKDISTASYHTCGITQNNGLYCWGSGYGSIGLEPQVARYVPEAVAPGQAYTQVSVGDYASCAITTEGALYCWGSGPATGTGQFAGTPLPLRIGTDAWSQVSVRSHACGIRVDGALFCWGTNDWGELGSPVSIGSNYPVQVGAALDWKRVEVGDTHTCAINQARQLYCWGSNSSGQIGNEEPWVGEPQRVWPHP